MNWCTAVPDKIGRYDMSGCCEIHDHDYEQKVKSRKRADEDFYN